MTCKCIVGVFRATLFEHPTIQTNSPIWCSREMRYVQRRARPDQGLYFTIHSLLDRCEQAPNPMKAVYLLQALAATALLVKQSVSRFVQFVKAHAGSWLAKRELLGKMQNK